MAARISAAGSANEVEPDSEGKRQFLDSIDGAGGEVTDDDLQENKGRHGEAGPDEHGLDRCHLEPPQSRKSPPRWMGVTRHGVRCTARPRPPLGGTPLWQRPPHSPEVLMAHPHLKSEGVGRELSVE